MGGYVDKIFRGGVEYSYYIILGRKGEKRMEQMLKRISSLVLCLALLASGWPVGTMAEEARSATPAEAEEGTDGVITERTDVKECNHNQAAAVIQQERSYWPIGDEQHSVTVYQHEVTICPECDTVLKDESVEIDAFAEEHVYSDEGVCLLCAHTAPAVAIMPLSLDIIEEETTRAMSLSVEDIIVSQAFSFNWSKVPYADHYEVAITRIDVNNQEHKLLGNDANTNRQNVGTDLSFTVSAADVAADTKRMRIYVGAAPDSSFPTPWENMIKDVTTTIDVRYDASKEMDVQVSVSGDTATVEWVAVAGANHYLYKVLDATSNGAEVCPQTQTQALSFELPGLNTGHEYKIWVASYDAGGEMIAQHTSQTKLLRMCDHEQTVDVESGELFGNLTETTHERYARFDVVCKACGEVIFANQIKAVDQEEHAFTGNVCAVCGYDRTDKDAVITLTVGEAISGKPLTASWNAIDGAQHYQYDVKDLTTDTSLFGGMQTTAETSLTVDGAKVAAGHEYKIWAAAFGADGVMLTQGTQMVTAEQVAAVLTLNIGPAVGGQTLIVTWNEIEDIDHYQYNIRNLSTDTPIWGETGESTQIPSLMLNGILVDDNVEYRIWVGAFDASGSMMAQATQTVKSTAAQGNPMNLSYSGTPLAGVDLQMSWSKMSDAGYYEYSLRDVTADTSIYSRVETTAAYFTIPGAKLEANHSYRFWVGAIGEDGAEPDGSHQGSVSFMVVQCPHGSATPRNEVATRTSISDIQHHVVKTYDLYCTYCDTIIEKGKKEEYDEKHNLDDAGDCTLCDYRKECRHENQVKKYVDTTYLALEDGEHHRVTDIYSLVCVDCGKVIVQLDSSLNEVKEDVHSLTNDVCTLCGYTKAEQFGVTVKLDQQTAKCGEMVGAEAVVVGGSGSYKYGWEIYRDGVKVASNSDCGKRCTFTASGDGQWKFIVRVTDSADDESFWAESANVKVEHAATSEEIADKRKIERNDQKTHTVVKTMHVTCACGEVDRTEEVREPVEHTRGSAVNKTEHPHRKYFVCSVCGQEIDSGENGYNAGCSTCNPPKTGNTGNQSSQGTNQQNTNEAYSKDQHVHSYSFNISAEKDHPHQIYGYCECGERTDFLGMHAESMNCCECVGHLWTEIYRLPDGKTYQRGCTRCGKIERVDPPANIEALYDILNLIENDAYADQYKNSTGIDSYSTKVWKIVASQATNKLTDEGFVYTTEALNVYSDMAGSIGDAAKESIKQGKITSELKDWDEQKEGYWKNILIRLLKEQRTEVNSNLGGSVEDIKEGLENSVDALDDLADYADDIEDMFEDRMGELNEAIGDLDSWISDVQQEIPGNVKINETIDMDKVDKQNTLTQKKLKLEEIRKGKQDDLDVATKNQKVADTVEDTTKSVRNIMEALNVLAAGTNDAKQVIDRNRDFEDMMVNGARNIHVLNEVIESSEKMGNEQLQSAAASLKEELEEEMKNQANTYIDAAAAFIGGATKQYVKDGIENAVEDAAEELLEKAIEQGSNAFLKTAGTAIKDSAQILGAIEGAAKIGKMTLNWDPAYQQAQTLMTYSVMDSELSILNTLEKDEGSKYMAELWKMLQVQGCDEAKEFLNTWDEANGVSMEEFTGKLSKNMAIQYLEHEQNYFLESIDINN